MPARRYWEALGKILRIDNYSLHRRLPEKSIDWVKQNLLNLLQQRTPPWHSFSASNRRSLWRVFIGLLSLSSNGLKWVFWGRELFRVELTFLYNNIELVGKVGEGFWSKFWWNLWHKWSVSLGIKNVVWQLFVQMSKMFSQILLL